MPRPLRIAFAGRFYGHNGSSHALLGYVRAGRKLGYDVRVSALGIFDHIVQDNVPVADVDWKPDVLVFVFEERFLRDEGFARAERLVPRSHRLVIDPDGKYFEPASIGTDTNHPTPDSKATWSSDFERLSDTILQPRLGDGPLGSERFLFFGVDAHREHSAVDAVADKDDLVYVGNNWYRWHDIVWLLEGLAAHRDRIPRISIYGHYWEGEPLESYEEETYSDLGFLRAHGVRTFPSVPFDAVESTMASGRLSPIFIRPILNALRLVTPRMFETFAADTIPLLPHYMDHAVDLFGESVEPLLFSTDPSRTVLAALENEIDFKAIAAEIRDRLSREHSYEVRLEQLLGFIPSS